MQYTEIKFNDLRMLDIKYPNLHHISNAINVAYSTIFCTPNAVLGTLTEQELYTINQLILSCFELLKTLPDYDPQGTPVHDIIRMVRIAISHWFYKQYQTKRVKDKLVKTYYIWQIPQHDQTELRRKFKRLFGAMPEQLLGACCFYLIPTLIESIKKRDLWTYGAIISTVAESGIMMTNNAKFIAGGKIIHTAENKFQRAYKLVQKDYPKIKNKPIDEKVLYCQEHFHLSEQDASNVLARVEKETIK